MRFLVAMVVGVISFYYTSQREDANKEKMALGWVSRTVFEHPEHHEFKERYDTVTVQMDLVELIRHVSPDVEVTVVLGTWCSDSQREIPRFLKIVDLIGLSEDRIRYYGVDRSKKSDDGVTEKYGITLVPTFIFMKHGSEIGRIVEVPATTMEEEMLSILATAFN